MQQWKEALAQAAKAKRCTASNRQGNTCKSPAMTNGKCRMHGGASTGAPCGKKHGRYKHGRCTKEMIAQRIYFSQLLREAGATIDNLAG